MTARRLKFGESVVDLTVTGSASISRNRCEHWLDCRFHSDAQAARLIADLRLDVLVELGGYTSGSRLGILVHRPAPIQLSYLGFPAPTYLNCVDGWLGDEVLFGGLSPTDRNAHANC